MGRNVTAKPGRYQIATTPYQKEPQEAFTDPEVQTTVLYWAKRLGKALSIDTKIPTPCGWKTMGDLKLGDTVFGSDGKPCKVIFATEVMHGRPCNRVCFSDGSEIIADDEHLWKTNYFTNDRLRKIRRVTKTEGIRTTKRDFHVVSRLNIQQRNS